MHTDTNTLGLVPVSDTKPDASDTCSGRPLRLAVALAALVACGAAQAIDFGPFTLNGFLKSEVKRGSNNCENCQLVPGPPKGYAYKDMVWADDLAPGAHYGPSTNDVTLFQPWLGAHFDLPGGFKISGMLSQRWRDWHLDIPGFLYERNVAVSHESYGRLAYGSMTTRTWSVADYPYGTNIGVADEWASSGAGYGLLEEAVRYTSRPFDVFEGDLVVEATYDNGNGKFKRNSPRFWEFYVQYHRGDLVLDAMFQDTRNGTPGAWGHGPFTGLTPFPRDDAKLGGSGQGMAMLMARYQINSNYELTAGIRRNRWSGAYAVCVSNCGPNSGQWNNMFNVDWGGTRNGVKDPGYAATSVDAMLGLRYRVGKWVAHTGMVYLGTASTHNPSDRGQHNEAFINTIGLGYEFYPGFQVYSMAGMVNYGRRGLSPMSMPGNAAFSNVDSRVSKYGNWFGIGTVWVW